MQNAILHATTKKILKYFEIHELFLGIKWQNPIDLFEKGKSIPGIITKKKHSSSIIPIISYYTIFMHLYIHMNLTFILSLTTTEIRHCKY